MDVFLEFAEESMTVGVLRLRELNELVRHRELEVAEGADGLAESVDITDTTRERLRSSATRLRERGEEFLAELDELEEDVRTAITVGRTSEAEARVASWRGTDRLTQRIARLGEQLLLRWMHLDRVERVIVQLIGEQDLKSIGVTEFPWPERKKKVERQEPQAPERRSRWWPFGWRTQHRDAEIAVEEAMRVLGSGSDKSDDRQSKS